VSHLLSLAQRVRAAGQRQAGRRLPGPRAWSHLAKWIPLGIVIGVLSGLGAVAFQALLNVATAHLLGTLTGYHPAKLAGEGGLRQASGFPHPWAVPLVVAVGALAGSALVIWLAPEAEGHGTDAAIAAAHSHPKGIRARVAAVKLLASAVTIGSGGSGGTEGPAAQISAALASTATRRLRLSPGDAHIAVSAGMASGVGAVFRTPLGGAVLGAELLYRDDVAAETLIPSAVTSVVAFTVFGAFYGFHPLFGGQHLQPGGLSWTKVLLPCAVLGLLAGLLGRLYVTCFYSVTKWFSRSRLPRLLRPAVAGLAVGALGLAVPGVLGPGYGSAQLAMDGNVLVHTSLWVILLAPFAKIVGTSLSVGSGGSGGVFGPGLVIGAATGAALWRLFEPLGLAPRSPLLFVVVGMAACLGPVVHAPLAVVIMVGEATGSFAVVAPALLAVAVATFVVGDVTLYRSQPATRRDAPLHRSPAGELTEVAATAGDGHLARQPGQSDGQPDGQLGDGQLGAVAPAAVRSPTV